MTGQWRGLTSGLICFLPFKDIQLSTVSYWECWLGGELLGRMCCMCGGGEGVRTWPGACHCRHRCPSHSLPFPGACKPGAFWESEHLFLGSGWGSVAYCFPQPLIMTMTESVLNLVLMAHRHWRVSYRGCTVLVSNYWVKSKLVAESCSGNQ